MFSTLLCMVLLSTQEPSSKNNELKKPFYANIQSSAGEFGDTGHKTEVETDGNYEEVKHTVETPFTMDYNMAYSTTTTTTHT